MNQSKMDWEYTVEESEKTHPMVNRLDSINLISSMVEVVAELRLLSQEVDISTITLRRIRDSLRVLSQSLEEQE